MPRISADAASYSAAGGGGEWRAARRIHPRRDRVGAQSGQACEPDAFAATLRQVLVG